MALPPAGYFLDPTRTNFEAKQAQDNMRDVIAGNVTGPASATDGSLARFDGTTGKLLKDGAVIGTSAGNVVALDGSAKLPAVDGSQLTGIDPGTPTGSMIAFAGISAPSGWLLCSGQAVSRTTYAALFAAIGTTFGAGDGSTTFNLPDARGRMVLGSGAGPGLTDRTHGTAGGDQDAVVVSHGHELSGASIASAGAHSHVVYYGTQAGSANSVTLGNISTPGQVTGATLSAGAHTHSFSGGTDSAGAAGTDKNMPPWIALNWIIKT